MSAVAQHVRRDPLRGGPPALVRRRARRKASRLDPLRLVRPLGRPDLRTDPEGGTENPSIVRVPNGALLDDRVYWSAGKPVYNRQG